jgi:phage replication O-like protein O
MTNIPAPNYTQIPNAILDVMADMSDAELRIVVAIARQTFGWHKKRDKISLSYLRKLTGMSRQGVLNGLAAGIARGLIERTPDEADPRGSIWYRLLVDMDAWTGLPGGLVHQVDQSTALTRTSPPGRPELVHQVDTQKKGKEKKERESVGSQSHPPALALLFEFFPDAQVSEKQIAAICSTATDVTVWRQLLTLWQENGWQPRIGNLLDRYRNGASNGIAANPATERPTLPVAPYRPPADALPRTELAKRLKELQQR